jgi:uncharacterized protein YggE
MKTSKSRFLLFLFTIILSAGACTSKQEEAKVVVTGSATAEVAPDAVRWRLSIRSESEDSEALAKKHANRLEKLLAYLKGEGIAKKDIRTKRMSLSENWNYQHGKRFKQGYVANSSVEFTSDIDSYTKHWKALSADEGVSISSSNFELKDKIKVEKQTRTQALIAAKLKASAMAKALGVSIGKPIYIEDLSWGDDVIQPMPEVRMMSAKSPAQDIVSPGTMKVRMRVKVAFEIK